jgi:hypothetical protein
MVMVPPKLFELAIIAGWYVHDGSSGRAYSQHKQVLLCSMGHVLPACTGQEWPRGHHVE